MAKLVASLASVICESVWVCVRARVRASMRVVGIQFFAATC